VLKQLTGSRVVASKRSGAEGLDVAVDDGDRLDIGGISLEVRATPGHTDGCVSYVLADHSAVFTGDALLIRAAGRTDFQQGSAERLYRSITERLFTLPEACVVHPGHDYAGRTVTTIGEEKTHNPRVGGRANLGDFVGYMSNLRLPHPKQMDVAVPANLKSGRPDSGEIPAIPSWGPVVTTLAGILEIDAAWVAEHRADVTLIDVRESNELETEGRIPDALHLPLSSLPASAASLPGDRPVVAFCRSGRRSAQATVLLRNAGRTEVASLHGGFLEWRASGLPIVG